MKIKYARVLTRHQILTSLREAQEDVLWNLKGDIFAIQAAYRLVSRRIAQNGKLPSYADLSRRLTMGVGRKGRSRQGARIDGRTYTTLCRRLLPHLLSAAEATLQLVPPKREVFKEDADLERRRREKMYTAQVEKLDAIAASWTKPELSSPETKPVWCRTLNQWFSSTTEAARYISEAMGRERISRSDIRTAIKRGVKCAGLRFNYNGPDEGRPVPRIQTVLRPVRCLEMQGPPFESRARAAAFIGVSAETMRKALEGDGKIGGYTFVSCDPEPRKPIERKTPVYFSAPEVEKHTFEQFALFELEPVEPPEFGGTPRKRRRREEVEGQRLLFVEAR